MTNLTEQWKRGELQNNWYYIRTPNGIEKWEYIKQSHGFGYYETEWVLEVLAPVPSYEEWQQMKAFCEEFNALNVAQENQKLKELLRECRDLIEWYKTDCGYKDKPTESVLTKIDEVLK